jgi:hypothetical protein
MTTSFNPDACNFVYYQYAKPHEIPDFCQQEICQQEVCKAVNINDHQPRAALSSDSQILKGVDFTCITSLDIKTLAVWGKFLNDLGYEIKLSEFFQRCKHLTCCDFTYTKMNDSFIKVLSSVESLEKLTLNRCDQLIKPELNFKNLRSIYINNCSSLEILKIHSSTVKTISAVENKKLKKVSFRDLKQLDTAHLDCDVNLTDVLLSSENLGGLFMNHCTSLISLDLSETPQLLLLEIKNCKKLKNLVLGGLQLNEVQIKGTNLSPRLFKKMKSVTVISK